MKIVKSLAAVILVSSLSFGCLAEDASTAKPQAESETKKPAATQPAVQTNLPMSDNYYFTPIPVQLGKMPYDSKQEFIVRVINKGEKPLTIKKVRPSCSCLKARDFTKEEIAPGKYGEIKGEMIADKKEGKTRKLFYVHLSDKADPIAQIIINCEFVKADGGKLILSNKELDFGKVKIDAQKRLAVVRLMNFGDTPIKVTQIIGEVKGVTWKLDSEEAFEPRKGVTLRAWLEPKEAGAGAIDSEIFIMTNSPQTPAVTVKVKAKVE